MAVKKWLNVFKGKTKPSQTVDSLKYNNQAKIKLIAVAKDEAAYLAEWVHHHQYFGFDAIDVYVNRTSDNSLPMLAALQDKFPALSFKLSAWVDKCPTDTKEFIQYLLYANALEREQELGEFDFVMFLDIDEFWTPLDMTTSIQDCIGQNPSASMIVFNWFNEHGLEKPYSPIQQEINGQLSPLVKTLIKVKSKVLEISLHIPLTEDTKCVLVDGESFIPDPVNRECVHPDLIAIRPIMIIHRMFRSPMEYVSLLSRGRPSDNLPLKLNRGGYNRAQGTHLQIVLDETHFINFQESRRAFLSDKKLLELSAQASLFVEQRAAETYERIKDMPLAYFIETLELFNGCPEDIKAKVKASLKNAKCLADPLVSKDELFSLAADMQKYDIELARIILSIASKLKKNM